MSQMQFVEATREQLKARVGLIGPAGSGKTRSALEMAAALGKRIAVIDTEHGSARKFAGQVARFDVLELKSFAPSTYVAAIQAAERAGYDVLVIDSLSHAWMGKDGALEMVDRAAKRSQSNNTFAAWRDVTPEHNRLVEALVACNLHLIVTMRAKTEYILEDVDGKKVPRKVGMAPIQRDGLEYEFDVVGDLTLRHDWIISKSRCDDFDGLTISKPGREFAEQYARWLDTGEARAPRPAPAPEPEARRPKHAGDRKRPGDAAPAAADPAPVAAPTTPTAPVVKREPVEPVPTPAAPTGPKFEAFRRWEHVDDWMGHQLTSAPLHVLLSYDAMVVAAIADPKMKPRIRALMDHRADVRLAVRAVQQHAAAAIAPAPANDHAAAGSGWSLSDQGGTDDEDDTATAARADDRRAHAAGSVT